MKLSFIDDELKRLKENNLYRAEKVFSSPQSSHAVLNGKDVLMLSSNSYLDLCHNSEIAEYVKKSIDDYGTGSGGSRLTTGTFCVNKELEALIAEFKHCEDAIVFNTGYMANVGVISAICNREWTIFSDELNHASIIDGCRLSKAKIVVYRHNDMVDLESKLEENKSDRMMIVSDGVFSMDGDIVNLPELVRLADLYDALSVIDDAHATGVIGRTGRGTSEHYGVAPDITVGTLSKAIGSEGGFVCASGKIVDFLRNKTRSYIFSTAMSPSSAAASIAAIRSIMNKPSQITRLQENVKLFCDELNKSGVQAQSQSAIVPIIIGDESAAMNAAADLLEMGYFVSAIRYPTVAHGQARLRATIMATHTSDELKRAAHDIADIIRRYRK